MLAPKDKSKIKLSASKIKTLQNCSWTYHAQYVLKLPQSPNTGASRGLCAHIVLECLINPRHSKRLEELQSKSSFPESVTRLIEKHAKKLKVDDPENLQMISEMILTAVNFDFKCEGAKDVKAEEQFRIETENYLINGFIDKTCTYPDGEIEIWDYKTSKAKFNKEEIESNMQALMYSLACLKQTGKIPKIKFLFLRFPRQPLQEPHICSQSELRGFERYLETISRSLAQFDEKKALKDMAVHDESRRWLCGKEGFKKDGSKAFICQYRNPFDYYAILDQEGNVVSTSFEKSNLKPGDGQSIKKLYYSGCPAFRKEEEDSDPFNF
jgi:hypothetical protein